MIALREWRVYLSGRKFRYETDHEPLRYLQTKSRLTGRQARWLDQFQEHSFEVSRVAGKHHIVPDALSRRPDHQPSLRRMETDDQTYMKRIRKGYSKDEWSRSILEALANSGASRNKKVSRKLSHYSYDGTFLHWVGTYPSRIYVLSTGSLRSEIIENFQKPNHLGIEKTYNVDYRI